MRSTTVMPNVRLPYVALAITSYSISPQSATGARNGKTHITYMVNEQTHTCAWNLGFFKYTCIPQQWIETVHEITLIYSKEFVLMNEKS